MQTTAKATRKVLSQFITVYQWILEFSLEKVWLEVIIKHNKMDSDDMLDDINAKLIEVCGTLVKEYLEANKSKREALERIKNENEILEKEIETRRIEAKRLASEKKVNISEKPEMPAKSLEGTALGTQAPVPKPKVKRRGTDALAIDNLVYLHTNGDA